LNTSNIQSDHARHMKKRRVSFSLFSDFELIEEYRNWHWQCPRGAKSDLIEEIRRRKLTDLLRDKARSNTASNCEKQKIEAEYYTRYRALGFSEEEIDDIVRRIIEDR
jgi:hypothetical protein